jgi:O-antigen ligase
VTLGGTRALVHAHRETVALLGAAAMAGALTPAVGWYTGRPLLVPAALAMAVLAVIVVERPAVGLGFAFLTVPLGNLGVAGHPTWAFGLAWTVFVLAAVLWERTGARAVTGGPPLALALIAHLAVLFVGFAVARDATSAYPELRSPVTGFLLFLAMALGIRTRADMRWVLGGIAASVALVGAVAAREYLSGVTTGPAFYVAGQLVPRAAAGFGHPNALGGFFVLMLPFAVVAAVLERRGRWAYAAAAAVGAYGLYCTFSRGALIALLVLPLFFIRWRTLVALVPVGVLLGFELIPGVLRERFATLTRQGSELATRVDFWRAALDIWERHPLAGVGLGGFPQAYAASDLPNRAFLPDSFVVPPPHAHNLELQILATQGLLGLFAFGAVVLLAVRAARRLRTSPDRWSRRLGAASLASVAAFLVHNQLDVTLLEGTGIYFWALLGVLSAVVVLERADARA